DGADRQRHIEGRALAFSRARGLDRPAMQLDQVFDESQAEAEAAVPSGARRVGLVEAFKDIGHEITADAFARVAHADANVWVHALQPHFDATSLRRELDRVGEEVPDDLLQPDGVAGDLANFIGPVSPERDVLRCRGRVDRLSRLRYHRDQVHGADGESELTADDAGSVEQVIDQTPLRLPAALDDIHRLLDLPGVQAA